ncbi:MAG: hypothetical protein JWP10_120, partial [Nocardioidaceae bacterium]|nr:hypothetical protein [Nocardioidaceae bacterium]
MPRTSRLQVPMIPPMWRLNVSELYTDSAVTALPERARLLHIGLPKTGTTALQAAASASRPLLLDHGVRYPGKNYNHRFESSGLLGRRFGSVMLGGGKEPQREQWDEMMAEIEA